MGRKEYSGGHVVVSMTICHLHISYNAPYLPPKILHNLCFLILLGITAVPREIENNALGQMRRIMGDVQVVNSNKRQHKRPFQAVVCHVDNKKTQKRNKEKNAL